jgi:hypothetical protein
MVPVVLAAMPLAAMLLSAATRQCDAARRRFHRAASSESGGASGGHQNSRRSDGEHTSHLSFLSQAVTRPLLPNTTSGER